MITKKKRVGGLTFFFFDIRVGGLITRKKKELVDFIFVKIWWLTLKINEKGWWVWKNDILRVDCFIFLLAVFGLPTFLIVSSRNYLKSDLLRVIITIILKKKT